jgi:hypothetical protein
VDARENLVQQVRVLAVRRRDELAAVGRELDARDPAVDGDPALDLPGEQVEQADPLGREVLLQDGGGATVRRP